MPLLSVQEIINAQADADVSHPKAQATTYSAITTSAQTLVKTGAGILCGINLNVTSTSAIRGYDNTVSGGSKLFTIPASTTAQIINITPPIKFSTGLVVSSGAAADDFIIRYV